MIGNSQPHGDRTAVILLAKGGYGEWPRRELERMLSAVRETGRYALVEGAFLDQGDRMGAHLPAAMERCLDAGARRIIVVPAFVPVDRTLRMWLPKAIRRWTKRRHLAERLPEVRIVLAPALGDHPSLGLAAAAAAEAAEWLPDVREGAPAKDVAEDWVGIPPYRYHVFLCAGPRCATIGSNDVWAHLQRRLDERGLYEAPEGVITTKTGCLYPCNWGPIMVVHPDNCWYGAVDEETADEIVERHFVGGQPVERALRPRPRGVQLPRVLEADPLAASGGG